MTRQPDRPAGALLVGREWEQAALAERLDALMAGHSGLVLLGGVLLVAGGYGALGIGLPLFGLASALLAWRPALRSRLAASPIHTVSEPLATLSADA